MNKSIINKVISITSALSIFMTATVFAVSSMTYSGQGIRGKRSVGRITVKSGIQISHKNSNWNVPRDLQEMEIWADKNTWHGWSTKKTYTTTGSGTTNFTFTKLPSGTYSLYFHAPSNPAAANIDGTATGK